MNVNPDAGAAAVGLRSPRLVRAARWWSRRELGRTLDGLRTAGLSEARRTIDGAPALFVANHVAFWDVFVLLALDDALDSEGYAIMDEANLCRIPFFARLGAVPLRRGAPRAGLRAAASLLDRPGRALWIFPQGGHRPAHLRPLGFQPGVGLLARLLPPSTPVVPVALQYAFGQSEGPVAYAAFGSALDAATVGAAGGVERVEAAVRCELERVDRLLAGENETFEALIPSRSWEAATGAGTRVLNWWLGAPRGRRPPGG